MPLVQARPINFYLTTLRAAVTPSDTQFLLAAGSTAPLAAITAGQFLFLTVSDGVTTEVVMYTSTGSVINDTIIVERGHDNTTAKAFPAGACVAVGWNVAQVEFLIAQFFNDPPPLPIVHPVNTTTIVGINAVPSGAPADNIIYTVNLTTGQMWYWEGSIWVPLSSNNVQTLPGPPVSAPIGGVTWTFDSVAFTLYFWDGAAWQLVSAQPGYTEVFGRTYLDAVGVALTEGTDNSFSDMIDASTITPTTTYYQSNPLVTGIISENVAKELVFSDTCIAELTASVVLAVDDTKDVRARLVLFHAASLTQYTTEVFHPANSGNVAIGVTTSTGPIQLAAADEWDCSLVLTDGGVTYAGGTLTQFEMNAVVIALVTV
jgi:hypothetical protein